MEEESVSRESTINEFNHLPNLETSLSVRGGITSYIRIPYSPSLAEGDPGRRRQL